VDAFGVASNGTLVQEQDRSEIEDGGDFQRETQASRQIVSAFSVMESDNTLPAPGDVVRAKYRVEGIIGSGGMGAVLAARHVVTGKPVALKWLRANLAREPEWMQRFLREARAAGRIQHPNVVDIYDVDEHRGVLFLVMERLNGRPLSAVLAAESALPWRQAMELMLPVMRGVHAAHRHGVLHRDLKPANIFLCEDDRGAPLQPKVLDFGISKIIDPMDGDSLLTETGAQLGTPAYMAPEQLSNAGADQRVDVYALGVILYRILSGRLPHNAPTPAGLAIKIATEDPAPLDSVAAIPSELAAIVKRAMCRDPNGRFRDVGELISAIERLAGTPTPQRYPAAAARAERHEATPTPIFAGADVSSFRRRSKLRTFAPWLLAAGVTALLVRGGLSSLERPDPNDSAHSSAGTTGSVRREAPSIETAHARLPVVTPVVDPNRAQSSPPAPSASTTAERHREAHPHRPRTDVRPPAPPPPAVTAHAPALHPDEF
jgi:serine/threonine protein kinase